MAAAALQLRGQSRCGLLRALKQRQRAQLLSAAACLASALCLSNGRQTLQLWLMTQTATAAVAHLASAPKHMASSVAPGMRHRALKRQALTETVTAAAEHWASAPKHRASLMPQLMRHLTLSRRRHQETCCQHASAMESICAARKQLSVRPGLKPLTAAYLQYCCPLRSYTLQEPNSQDAQQIYQLHPGQR